MELRRLRLLFELSRLGTIAEVADALSFHPSTVSLGLSQLEKEAGYQLLRRAGRNVELTVAGQRLAEYAEQALAAEETILADLSSIDDTPKGVVRISFVQTPALAVLPPLLRALNERAPDLRVEVEHQETKPALELLRTRLLDIVVGVEYEPLPVARHRDVHREDLFEEEMVVCQRRSSGRQRQKSEIHLSELERAVWASGHAGTGLDAVISNVCNRAGFAPQIGHHSDDALILAAIAASGRAVTLLPSLFVRTVPTVQGLTISDGPLYRRVFTAVRASNATSRSVELVREILRQTVSELGLSETQPPRL